MALCVHWKRLLEATSARYQRKLLDREKNWLRQETEI